MISKRLLTKWRKQALQEANKISTFPPDDLTVRWLEIQERILRLTQELLDQELLRRT